MIKFNQLSDEQKLAFHVICRHVMHFDPATDKNPIVLDANGGSGKSTLVRCVKDYLHGTAHFALTAFTGRACAQISKDSPDSPAQTSHAILKKAIVDHDGNLISFEDKTKDEILGAVGRAIIVDEGSMYPYDMYKKIMSLGIPVVIIGDTAQLPSIEPKTTEGFNAMDVDEGLRLTLTRNFRQEQGSAIADLCMHLRENNSIPRRKSHDLKMILKSGVFKLRYHMDNEFDAVICGTNATRRKLNSLIRKARGYHEEIPETGELIMCKRNDMVNNVRINNGEMYRVDGVFYDEEVSKFFITGVDNDKKVTVNIPNHVWETERCDRTYKGNPIQHFVFGYAMTCHAAQGSQFDNVLYIDEDVSYFLDQQKFRYTAVSRAAKHLTISI